MKATSGGSEAQETYQSYLLRLWQVRERQGATWRASLESVRTGQRAMFSDLEALFEYLRAETGIEAAPEQDRGFGNLPSSPKSGDRSEKGGDDANSVDPEAADL